MYTVDVDQDGIISRNDMYDVLNMISDGTLTDAVKERVVDEVRRGDISRYRYTVQVYMCTIFKVRSSMYMYALYIHANFYVAREIAV